jgi:hypothetical protein
MALLVGQVSRRRGLLGTVAASSAPCVCCFHDDNVLLPRFSDSLSRFQAIRQHLDARGVGPIALVGKCRPETIDAKLARELRELGLIRLYVGIENASPAGAEHLGRGAQHLAIGSALDACRQAGIFACYNILLFEPRATLDDVAQNIAFMREHAEHPVNFCRAEPYVGTPLYQDLKDRSALRGSYLGFDYRVEDDRTELLFRICAAAFRERNFRPDGVANRTMGLGYMAKLLEFFCEDEHGEVAKLSRRATDLTRRIILDTVHSLEAALELAANADLADRESIERRSTLLGLEIAATDSVWQRELDDITRDFEACRQSSAWIRSARRSAARVTRRVVVGASLALEAAAAGCGGDTDAENNVTVVDAHPYDAGEVDVYAKDATPDITVVDALPFDAGFDSPVRDAAPDITVVDALPFDAGFDSPVRDAAPDITVVDILPFDAGFDSSVLDAARDSMIVDPLVPDSGRDSSGDARLELMRDRSEPTDHWRDTSPKRAVRSDDLPMYDPPDIRIAARREGRAIIARVEGGPSTIGTKWEAEGSIDGDGREVRWTPSDDRDTLRVAVRARGGFAVVSVRAGAVRG